MEYRPDIDGMRAIAVLSVIAFHINADLMPGGFVGVDIFFVISGFLISLQIFRQSDAGSFSLGDFYRRRIKRIAPAMLVVLASVLVLSQFLFRPEDAEGAARSAFWSLLSAANVHFWMSEDGSYFAASSDEFPLLHFWSLGVEEQYYLLWPVVLIAFAPLLRSRAFAIGATLSAAASFAFAELYFSIDPSFVYYMLPARAGELLLGAIVAWRINYIPSARLGAARNQLLAACGLALVVASLYGLNEELVFPGLYAIPPTLGAALLIYSGSLGSTWIGSTLAWRPMVWIGLVSYSAYLWHWPILAFLRYGGIEISILVGSVVVALTLMLAWLSYRFVETPLRRSRNPLLGVFARQYAAPALVLGALAAVSLKTDGWFVHRLFPDYVRELEHSRQTLQPAYDLDYVCQSSRLTAADLTNANCVVGADLDGEPDILLWGDSNAAHYIGMLQEFGESSSFAFRNVEVGGCPPLNTDLATYATARRADDCAASSALIWPFVKEYDTVVIGAFWTGYVELNHTFLTAFSRTVDSLNRAGRRVILLGQAPYMEGYDRLCSEKALSFPGMDCRLEPVPFANDVADVNRKLRAIAAARPLTDYFDANGYLCEAGHCSLYDAAGRIRYYNAGHLTMDASAQLGGKIVATEGVPQPFSRLGSSSD